VVDSTLATARLAWLVDLVGPERPELTPATVVAVIRLHNHLERVSNLTHHIEIVVILKSGDTVNFRDRDGATGGLAIAVAVNAQGTIRGKSEALVLGIA